MIKEIPQRQLGLKNFSRCWTPPFSVPAQKVAPIEASTEMLRILYESEENHFEGIATGDGSWFQSSSPSLKMLARSPTDPTPRTRQAIGTKKTIITIFFTRRKLIVLEILSKGSKFNLSYIIDYISHDLKRQSMNFRRRIPHATFWVHMNNSMYQNGPKAASKFEKHHVSRLLHPPYSPKARPCDFWLFGMLTGVLKDRGLNSSNEIEEATLKVWDELTFNEAQSVFHNWMSRLASVIENRGEYIIE
jgi:hypothetical protein